MYALCRDGEPVVFAGENCRRDHAEWVDWWQEFAPEHEWTVERVG